jgi:hypothetical protein
MNIQRVGYISMTLSLAFLAFLAGFAAYHFRTFPYALLEDAYKEGVVLMQVGGLSKPHLVPAVYDTVGAETLLPEAMQPGLTLLTSYWQDLGWKAGLKLITRDGTVVHSWTTDAGKIWPSGQDGRLMRSYVHGAYLFPDGDVLFNIEYVGLARMDACGKVRWHLNYETHHSIARADNGDFWVSGNVTRSDKEYLARFPGLSSDTVYEDHLLRVSADGEILEDINLLEVVYQNGLQRYLVKISKRREGDIFHLNDVEPLPQAMADQYPMFDAGDLLISLKHMDLVFVMDPDTGKVKWHASDAFIEQHDPDFIGDGWVGIFDNNRDGARGRITGGSRIVALRPHTGESKVLFPGRESEPFYTDIGGKWQLLPNGNILLLEAGAGRVLEVDSNGRTVWRWTQEKYDEKRIPEVLGGDRYPYTVQQVSGWGCPLTPQVPSILSKS